MKKFHVNYSNHLNYKIVVEAEGAEEAHRKVEDGEVDFDEAVLCDEDFGDVNNVEEIVDGS